MSDNDKCPRNFTRDQMEEGLRKGRSLIVDRVDAPELPELLEMERKGYVTMTTDEATGNLRFRWKEQEPKPNRIIPAQRKWRV